MGIVFGKFKVAEQVIVAVLIKFTRITFRYNKHH